MTHISPPLLRHVSMDDKYKASQQDVFMTGIEALVRLPMLQHEIDQQSGLNTAGFISGYRGSPLGGVDQALWKAKLYVKYPMPRLRLIYFFYFQKKIYTL